MSAFSQSVWFSRLRRLLRFQECPLTVHLGDEISLWQSLGCLFSSCVLNVCRLSRFDQHLVDMRCWCLTHSGPPTPPFSHSKHRDLLIIDFFSNSFCAPFQPPGSSASVPHCFLLMVIALKHKGDDYPAFGVLAILYVTHPLPITYTNRIIQCVVGKSTYRDGERRRFGCEKKD